MIKIGLTGGIGSGKSTVASVFEELGVPVYYADFEAKEFLKTSKVKDALVDYFGRNMVVNGEVDKAALASIIFNDREALQKVNNLIHPLVRQGFAQWAEINKSHAYLIIEVAILFENGFDSLVDKSVVVTAPYHQRLSRSIRRDASNAEAIKSRMNNQWPQERLIEKADFVLKNDNDQLLLPQILALDGVFRDKMGF